MTSTSSSRPNCDYCGLPVPQPLLQRRHPEPDGPRYCCYGCRFAAAISAEDGTEASARWTLTRLGLAIFFAMNVMVFTMTLWSYDVYEPDLSDPLTATFAQLLRYLCLLFSLPVLFLLGKPIADNAWDQPPRRCAVDRSAADDRCRRRVRLLRMVGPRRPGTGVL